jgi:DNA repair exonuclease SbcCD ATPase subunit
MALKFKTLKLKNFLSIGNVEQSIDLSGNNLTLVLGENKDLGGSDAGSRNGCGKTSALQGISYALFGSAINAIKLDNLINRTNEKNMVVTLEFEANDINYKIVRGRKPNVLKLYIEDAEQVSEDEAQGENKQTQEAIERIINMSHTMFQHIIGLNSYTTPFLSMKVSEQREVIEQLLGITLLSEKAEAVKELIKETKDAIKSEEYQIRGLDEANKRISEQIDSLIRRQNLWKQKYNADLESLAIQYSSLSSIDIEAELQAHADLAHYTELSKQKENYKNLIAKQLVWKQKHEGDIRQIESQLAQRNSLDIDLELKAHRDLKEWTQLSNDISEIKKIISRGEIDLAREKKTVGQLQAQLIDLEAHKCYACGQDFHDSNHERMLAETQNSVAEATAALLATTNTLDEAKSALFALGEVGPRPKTHYASEAEAIRHSSDIENIVLRLEAKRSEIDPYGDQLLEVVDVQLPAKPTTIYRTVTEAVEHRSLVGSLEEQITKKSEEVDPYVDQIADMNANGIQKIDYTVIDELNKLLKHQDYLLDLLSNKKSFVRKKIIEQNLAYLNSRLSHYLVKIGLPHQVIFQNDLSVEISELSRELSFYNLSRGEMNRVILALSFAFRDVWENLFSSVDLMFVDELMDSGMDTAGVENGLLLLKHFARDRSKSVWLVSHRDDLSSKVDSVLRVVKENGYTS